MKNDMRNCSKGLIVHRMVNNYFHNAKYLFLDIYIFRYNRVSYIKCVHCCYLGRISIADLTAELKELGVCESYAEVSCFFTVFPLPMMTKTNNFLFTEIHPKI